MPTPAFFELVKQILSKPVTNLFPSKYAPASIKKFLKKGKINPPIKTPDKFRGKLIYEKDKCIGCGMCVRVCPSSAMELVGEPPKRKIKHYVSRCTFCAICTEVCPVKCLHMSDEFLLADFDKHSENLIVG